MFKRVLKGRNKSRARVTSVAMEDPIELLLKISGDSIDSSDITESALLRSAKSVLIGLDLNGDGKVSWYNIITFTRFSYPLLYREEWLQVLIGCLTEQQINTLVHPMDPLVIRLRAAEFMFAALPSSDSADILSYSEYHHSVSRAFQRRKDSPTSATNTRSQFSKTLHLTDGVSVQSALIIEDFNDSGESLLHHTSSGYIIGKSSSALSLSQIITQGEDYDVQRLKSFHQLRKKSKAKRIRRSLKAFVNKLVPKLHNAIYSRKLENVRRILRGMVVRKRYLRMQWRRLRACSIIQRIFRGYNTRKSLKKRHTSACALQRVIRGARDRKFTKELRRVNALILWMRRKVAGLIVRRVIINWRQSIKARRDGAIKILRSFAEKVISNRRRCSAKAQEKKIILVQKQVRGKLARNSYSRKKRDQEKLGEKHDDVEKKIEKIEGIPASEIVALLPTALLKTADDLRPFGEINEEEMNMGKKKNESATKIQSVYRGMKDKRAYHRKREERAAKRLAEANERKSSLEKLQRVSAKKIQKLFKSKCVKPIKRPRSIQLSLGYNIEMNAAENKADDMHTGKVIGFNEAQNAIRVSFDAEKEGKYYVKDLPFDLDTILWKSAPPSSTPIM